MSCFHPLQGYQDGLTKNGKPHYKMLKSDHDLEPIFPDMDIKTFKCGRCIGCRMDYSRTWADRCLLESLDHDSSYFVTLTYNDKYLPRSYYVSDSSTGEVSPAFTLQKSDVQAFMKRLRRKFPNDDIRYYCAGEYGERYSRPHYHAIIFGLHLQDLVPYKKHNGYQYYKSQSLQNVWSKCLNRRKSEYDPFGFVVVGRVTWETAAYTARYATKKLNGDMKQFYTDHNIEPEFSLISNRPGIAAKFYDENRDRIYEAGEIYISTIYGSRTIRPPRYYDKKFDLDCPDEMAEIKAVREQQAKDHKAAILAHTDLEYFEYLRELERKFKNNAAKALKRSYEHGTS